MLEVHDLHTYRGGSYVLQGVSLEVPESRCVTLLGRNGMGKTTLIRSLMGLTPGRSGDIRFGGKSLFGLQPYEIARCGLGLVPQGRAVFPSLTVEENLLLGGRKPPEGTEAWTLDRLYELFPNLRERRRNPAGQLSGGEQQMLAIGRALMTNPRLLLMDEPTEGLAPVMVDRVADVIASLRGKLSILLVEQNYRLGINAADRVYILSKGTVVWSGAPSELEAAEEVRHAHLGV